MIDFNEIVVFIRVVEASSFSGAAQLLGLPRSTVSRKVSQLENSLGIRLLQRSTRKLSLTQAGRDYYQKCSNAFSEIERANQAITETQQIPSGVLRIAAPLVAQSGFLCDWINEFLMRHRHVTGEIILSDDKIDMIDEGIDVAFRAGVLDESTLVARKLGKTKLVVCASPRYLKKAPPINSINSLKNHDGISFGRSQTSMSWRLQNPQGITDVHLKGRVLVNSMEFALHACRAGLGVALLPIVMIGPYLQSNELKVLFGDVSSDVGGIYIVYPSKSHLSVTVRAFVDFMVEKSTDGLPWDKLS